MVPGFEIDKEFLWFSGLLKSFPMDKALAIMDRHVYFTDINWLGTFSKQSSSGVANQISGSTNANMSRRICQDRHERRSNPMAHRLVLRTDDNQPSSTLPTTASVSPRYLPESPPCLAVYLQ